MSESLIPALDPTPIPGPAWLFHGLLVFTFILHLLFMNLTLGGTLLAAVAQLTGGREDGDPRRALASRLVSINTFGISLTITTGVAPLLFVQVLYPQFFYSATILLGWIWFSLLILLMVGYYAVYAHKFGAGRRLSSPRAGGLWLVVAAILFFLVAMTQVAVNLLHSQPETWIERAANPWTVLLDPVYWPRLLHFLLAAVGLSAAVVAWWSVREAGKNREPELNRRQARYAWRWVLWTTAAQVVDGVVLLLVLPRRVLIGLMEGGVAGLAPLLLALALALGLLMMLARVDEPTERPAVVTGTLAGLTLVVAVMAITRHQVRVLYLAPAVAGLEVAEASQWGNFTLFALLLVAGLAVVAWMIRKTLAARIAVG